MDMQDYPENDIEKLNEYVINFNDDVLEMKEILKKLNNWVSKGIDIESSIGPLNNQINTWESVMDDLIEKFKLNITILKDFDDRINSSNTIEINEQGNNYKERWEYLYSIYKNIFINLEEDIHILMNVLASLGNYRSLGVELGNSLTIVNNQINRITIAVSDSIKDLNNIIETIKKESKKIINNNESNSYQNTNQEVIHISENNYLGVYCRYNFSQVSSMLYFNQNPHINWDPEIDGEYISQYMTKIFFDKKSPKYNEEIGEKTVINNSPLRFKYIYYGFSKNKMTGIKLNQSLLQYADQHGYQYTITVYHDSHIENTDLSLEDKYKEEFINNGKEYKDFGSTYDKLYIVYSCEEISDFSNIYFRGEEIKDA